MPFTLETQLDAVVNTPPLDWSQTPLAGECDGLYVKILDDIFTPAECEALKALAESDHKWEQAAVNYGLDPKQKFIDTSYRNSERILRFDMDAAQQLYNRLLPYIQELVEIRPGGKWATILSKGERTTAVWNLIGVNERLSFLRYGAGQFFKPHCDAELDLPDGRKARVTVQIYLGDEGVKGGATRIFGPSHNKYFDVEPKPGRVLIFQHRGVWHAGEEVTSGTKYTLRSDFLFRVEHLRDI